MKIKHLTTAILLTSATAITPSQRPVATVKAAEDEKIKMVFRDFNILNNEFVSAAGGQVNFYRIEIGVSNNTIELLGKQRNIYFYFGLIGYDKISETRNPFYFTFYTSDGTLQVDLNISSYWNFNYTVANPIQYDGTTAFNPFETCQFILEDNGLIAEKISFTIPAGQSTPPGGNWQALNLNGYITNYIDTESWKNAVYNEGYTKGHDEGYKSGLSDGTKTGYDWGLRDGYIEGANAVGDSNMFAWLTSMFSGISAIFSIEIFNGLTIGSIALILISFTLIPFIIGLFKGGGK